MNVPPGESFDIGNDGEAMPENGVARSPTEEKAPKPKPGHSRRAPDEPRAPVRAQDPPRDFAEGHNARNPGRVSEKDTWPTKPGPLWLKILDWLQTQEIDGREATPDDVMIAVERVSGGGVSGSAEFPDSIEGSAVAGSDNESADVALLRVLTDTFHLPISDRRSRASFRCRFYWRLGGKGDIKKSEPQNLPSPEEIRRARAARDAGDGERDIIDPSYPTTSGRSGAGKDYVHGRLEAENEALRRELETARRENRAPHPVERVHAATSQPVDWQERIDTERKLAQAEAEKKIAELEATSRADKEKRSLEERFAAEKAELQRKLDALEAKQKEEVLNTRLRSLEERLANPQSPSGDAATIRQQVLVELQAAGLIVVGPDGRPAPVTGTPYTTPAVTPAQQILDAVKVAADVRAAEEKTKHMLREAFGFVDPKTELVPAGGTETEEKEEEPGVLAKMMKFVGANMDMILAGGSVAVAAVADSLLQPGAAAVVKSTMEAAKEQAVKRQAAQTRTINPGVGAGAARGKPPSA